LYRRKILRIRNGTMGQIFSRKSVPLKEGDGEGLEGGIEQVGGKTGKKL